MKNANKPAMPIYLSAGEGFIEHGNADGFTKREAIAVAAMQGLCASGDRSTYEEIASAAVAYADALLEELEWGNND